MCDQTVRVSCGVFCKKLFKMLYTVFCSLFCSSLDLGNVQAEERVQPDIILVVTDDQRPDTIGALGNSNIRTPHLDRLVRSGMTFRRAYTGYPICYASRAQLITGCNAFTALENYPRSQINSQLATLANTLSGAGYTTVYSGKWHNDGNPLNRGYDRVAALYSAGGGKHVTMPETDSRGMPLTGYRGWTFKGEDNQPRLDLGVGLNPDNSRVIGTEVAQFIKDASSDKPLFLHVNFAFPHDPRMWPTGMEGDYDAALLPLPANFRRDHPFDHGNQGGRDEVLLPRPLDSQQVRQELAIYYAMITDVDREVGRILTSLEETGRLSNALFVFTSDQGLALGSHGLLGKQNQYEHSIRSPLVIAGSHGLCPESPLPDYVASVDRQIGVNIQSERLVQLSDLFPTLCDYAGVAIPETVQGKSLLPLLNESTASVHRVIYGVFTDTQRMICSDRWKLIHYPQAGHRQLFNLKSDPNEMVNRIDDPTCADVREKLGQSLLQWQKANRDPLLQ